MMHENAACTVDPEMREENGSNYIVFVVLGHRASLTCTTEPEWQVPLRQRQPHTPPSRPNRNTTNPKRLDPSRTTSSIHPTTTHHPQPTTPHPSPNANDNTHTQKEGEKKKERRCMATSRRASRQFHSIRATRLEVDASFRGALVVGVHVEGLPLRLVDLEVLALRRPSAAARLEGRGYPRHALHLKAPIGKEGWRGTEGQRGSRAGKTIHHSTKRPENDNTNWPRQDACRSRQPAGRGSCIHPSSLGTRSDGTEEPCHSGLAAESGKAQGKEGVPGYDTRGVFRREGD